MGEMPHKNLSEVQGRDLVLKLEIVGFLPKFIGFWYCEQTAIVAWGVVCKIGVHKGYTQGAELGDFGFGNLGKNRKICLDIRLGICLLRASNLLFHKKIWFKLNIRIIAAKNSKAIEYAITIEIHILNGFGFSLSP